MPNQAQLATELQALVQAELRSGESIVWLGQPNPSLSARRALPKVWLGIIWFVFCGFGALGIFTDPRHGNIKVPLAFVAVFVMQVCSLLLLASSAYMISYPYWAMRRARRIVYVITDRRVIQIESRRHLTVNSYLPAQLLKLERRESKDGSGDVIFCQTRREQNGKQQASKEGFLCIDSVREVERLLSALAMKSSGASSPTKLEP